MWKWRFGQMAEVFEKQRREAFSVHIVGKHYRYILKAGKLGVKKFLSE